MGNRVLVIGCAMIDTWKIGDAGRASPEDERCLILNDPTVTHELGGAANVAAWLAVRLGQLPNPVGVDLLAIHGTDPMSLLFRKICMERHGIKVLSDLQAASASITVKERICRADVGGAQVKQVTRLDYDRDDTDERGFELRVERTLSKLKEEGKYTLIVVADYGKGLFRGQRFVPWRQALPAIGLSIVVNAKKPDKWVDLAETMICNAAEHAAWRKRAGEDPIVTQPRFLSIVTSASSGSKGWVYGREAVDMRATRPPMLRSVVGAGDAYLAGVASEILHGARDGKGRSQTPTEFLTKAMETGTAWATESLVAYGCGAPTLRHTS